MRIGLLTHQWPGVRLGGIGAYTVHAAQGLARAGHEVHVFTFSLPAGSVAEMPGVTVHEVRGMAEQVTAGRLSAEMGMALQTGGEGMYRLGMGWLLCEELLRVHAVQPFDVVEGPEYEGLGLPLVMGEGFGGAVVTHLHSGSAIGRMVGNVASEGDEALKEMLELAVIAAADGVCAPSRAAIEDTREAYGTTSLLAHEMPKVVTHWTGKLAEEAEALALPFEVGEAEFEKPPKDGAVLFIGRLEWLKGAHVLVEAANVFLRAHPEARVRVVGPDTQTAPRDGGTQGNASGAANPRSRWLTRGGSMLAWMKSHLDEGVAGRVEFLGEMGREGMQRELKGCSFVVVPSLSETYSYVCCEAMAAGRAVVVSEGIGAAEVVGEGGRRFKKGDAADLARVMGEMWGDPGGREDLGRKAYGRARNELSGEGVIRRRVAFYERVVERRRKTKDESTNESHRAFWQRRAVGLAELMAALREGDWSGVTAFADHFALRRQATAGMKLVRVLASHRWKVRFYLYGAGRHTTRLLVEKPRWEAAGHALVGIIDDHPRFRETPEYLGLPVESCAAAAGRLGAGDVVILSTDAMEEQFWNQTAALRAKGVAVYRLYGR